MAYNFFGIFLAFFITMITADESMRVIQSGNNSHPKDSASSEQLNSSCCLEKNSRFQLGTLYSYVNITPAGNLTTTGNLYGIQGIYEWRPKNSFYGGVVVTWKNGNTSGDSGVSRFLCDVDAQERIGYTASFDRYSLRCSFFTGLGYRHLGEKLHSFGSAATFNYNDLYVPVGFLFDGCITSHFSLGVNFQWKPQVYPSVTIVPLQGARWILEKRIDNFQAELPFTFVYSQRYSVFVVPFFEYWNDGNTTASTTTGASLNVPSIRNLYAGVNVNVAIQF